jgi:tetratricopeptide (TPR) repeat protein
MNKHCFHIFFLSLCCFYFVSQSFAQQNQYYVDSLISSIANLEDGNDKVAHYNLLATYLKDADPDRALYYSRQALSLANQLQSVESCAISNKVMGEIFEVKHVYQPSINYYLISIKHFKSLGDHLELARLYNKLGHIYVSNHFDYEQGMEHFNKALEHAAHVSAEKEKANALNAIGGIYYYRLDYANAYHYFQEALKIRKQIGDEIEIAASLNNVGEIYRLNGDFEKALDHYNQAIQINEKFHHHKNLAVNYLNKGLIASEMEDVTQAKMFFEKSVSLNYQAQDTIAMIKSMTEFGNYFNKFGNSDKAIAMFIDVKQLSEIAQLVEGQRDADHGLSIAYEQKGNINKAFEHFRSFTHLKDSLFNRSKADQLDELHTRFSLDIKEKELEIKDNQIALLKREKEIFRFRQLFLLLSLIVLVIIAILFYSRLQLKHKKNRILLEKEAALSKARHELAEHELRLKTNDLTNFALHLIEKNKFLFELKKELKKLRSTPFDEREERIKELSINVQQNINLQKDLEEFQQNIDQVNAAFFEKLKTRYPNLTKNEINLCAMLRMNLSSKEIASLNNISIRAVEMGRYRLRKKFGLAAEKTICEFLEDL